MHFSVPLVMIKDSFASGLTYFRNLAGMLIRPFESIEYLNLPINIIFSELISNSLTLFGKIQHNYPLLDKIKENLGENQENSVFFIIKFYSLKKNVDFVVKTHLKN